MQHEWDEEECIGDIDGKVRRNETTRNINTKPQPKIITFNGIYAVISQKLELFDYQILCTN
jgi:hypothetical protein